MSRFILSLLAAAALCCALASAQPPDTLTIGMTWYENQHNGTCGRMNTLEPDGWRQFVWTKGENSGGSIRHIWWNGIDPNGIQVFPGTGVAVESTIRGGSTTVDVLSPSGAGAIAYHSGSNLIHPEVAIDLIPHGGAYLSSIPPLPVPNHSCGSPKIQIGQNGRIQLISTAENAQGYTPSTHWYISGTYDSSTFTITWPPAWTFMDSTPVNLADVAVSSVTNKMAAAWARSMPAVGSDLYYLVDADGLNPVFAQAINLTNFIPPDPSFFPDTLAADRDTFRLHNDVSLLFDQNDILHIAFTTRAYFYYEGISYVNASIIWHTTSQNPGWARMIAKYWNLNDNVNCGSWNLKAQRPSLGLAPNGDLYCAYQVYDTDTLHLSANGYPSGEIYVSKSIDGGMNWSQGINVTNTITPNHAAAGFCKSEICPSLAKRVDDYLHIEYVFDTDAGDVIQTQGTWTNNPVKYQRVPVAQIPTTPLVVQNTMLHVGFGPYNPEISLTPVNPPIITPSTGGQFQFNIAVIRRMTNPNWVWTRIKNPDGTYLPIIGPLQVNLPLNVWVQRLRTQNVPATWAPGVYTYLGYINPVFPPQAVDSSWFTFTKLATSNGGPWITDASCTGEPFPGEEFPPLLRGDRGDLVVASPNPFNATTAISFKLQAASYVSLKVYDSAGRLVTTLVEGWREAGDHEATFDGADLASGVYLYKLTANENHTEGKMVLLK